MKYRKRIHNQTYFAGKAHLSKLSNNENTTSKIKQIATNWNSALDQTFLQHHKTNGKVKKQPKEN
jgi:hypothetical protein